MYLTRHQIKTGAGWALDGKLLPEQFNLSFLLELPRTSLTEVFSSLLTAQPAQGQLLPPLEPLHEVWASGVTYRRSRDARQAESEVGDVYAKVYDAPRPELFLKAIGWRVVGQQMPIHIRHDSHWNVPEPELTLVINRYLEIVGYCVGNDVSSRDIEGENPLYLSEAKIYNGACALGPGIVLAEPDQLRDIAIQLDIQRADRSVFQGEVRSSQMKRSLEELVIYLGKELDFPHGVFLMTGTGLVPPDDFTLHVGDVVQITIGSLILQNEVQ